MSSGELLCKWPGHALPRTSLLLRCCPGEGASWRIEAEEEQRLQAETAGAPSYVFLDFSWVLCCSYCLGEEEFTFVSVFRHFSSVSSNEHVNAQPHFAGLVAEEDACCYVYASIN